jgi:thioredoxin-like negative regulator of GroEL
LAVKRVNADVGDGPTIMRDYRIPGHPTLLLFDDQGQEIARLVGPQAEEIVEDSLQNLLTIDRSQN